MDQFVAARPRHGHMSRRGIAMVSRWTTLGTLSCVAISLTYNWLAFRHIGGDAMRRGLLSATVLPIILAGPLFCYLSLKMRELGSANHQLAELASTDHLTRCLNRLALIVKVERILDAKRASAKGAMLVVDADHFKQVNDLFGHQHGDVALMRIAATLRHCVRQGDLVGRMGGEEFAVFLDGIEPGGAARIAERIRHAMDSVPLDIDGTPHQLTVSVGCIEFCGQTHFGDLFALADQRLYAAKRLGRNRVVSSDVADMKKAG